MNFLTKYYTAFLDLPTRYKYIKNTNKNAKNTKNTNTENTNKKVFATKEKIRSHERMNLIIFLKDRMIYQKFLKYFLILWL